MIVILLKPMIAVQTETKQQFSIAPEVLRLALDKTIAAKVLTWDMGMWGSGIGYLPTEIESIKFKGDILRFELSAGRAVHISADAFVRYWDSIQAYEAQMEAVDAEVEAKAEVSKTTVEAFPGEGVELDVIEIEIGRFVETRMGWIEEDWQGELYHHIFFEEGDDQELWLAAYRKSSERGSSRIEEDDDVDYISQLEETLTQYDLAGW